MPRLRVLLLLLLLAGSAGCATMPGDPAKMTAEQLREAIKDKSASIGAGCVQTPYKINMVYIVLDKAVVPNGTITVKSDCEVTITNTSAPAATR